jgi:hypothetical protein
MEDSAEAVLSAYDEAFDPVGFKGLGPGSQGCRGGKRSVGSVQVVVPLVLAKRVPEVGFVRDQRAVQEFGPQRLHPAFRDRVHAGHPDTGQHTGDLGAAENLVDLRGLLGVAVADEEPDLCDVSGVVSVHDQVADGLRNPGVCGVRGRAENADP